MKYEGKQKADPGYSTSGPWKSRHLGFVAAKHSPQFYVVVHQDQCDEVAAAVILLTVVQQQAVGGLPHLELHHDSDHHESILYGVVSDVRIAGEQRVVKVNG